MQRCRNEGCANAGIRENKWKDRGLQSCKDKGTRLEVGERCSHSGTLSIDAEGHKCIWAEEDSAAVQRCRGAEFRVVGVYSAGVQSVEFKNAVVQMYRVEV